MSPKPSGYEAWLCPFCGEVASLQAERKVLCDTRTCPCGAVAFAAPIVDQDEIIDDALDVFAVRTREESRGHDVLLLEDISHAGVEIREGKRARLRDAPLGAYTSLWFRRSSP